MFANCLRGFATIKNVTHLRNNGIHIFDDFRNNVKQNEFGGRCIDIGLENVAVAVARVVE